MQPITTELEPYLQKQLDMGSSGLDIIHGELKNLMYRVEELKPEAGNDETRIHLDGYLEALSDVYLLTYQLSFAIAERNNNGQD